MSFPSFSSFPVENEPSANADVEIVDATEERREEGEVNVHDEIIKKIKKKDKKKRKEKRSMKQDDSFFGLDFYQDNRGDLLNVQFQTIGNQAVPIYKRYQPMVVGHMDFLVKLSKNKKLILESANRQEPLEGKFNLEKHPIKFTLPIKKAQNEFDLGYAFVPMDYLDDGPTEDQVSSSTQTTLYQQKIAALDSKIQQVKF